MSVMVRLPVLAPPRTVAVPSTRFTAAAPALVVLLRVACVAVKAKFAAVPPEPPLTVVWVLVMARPPPLLFWKLALCPFSKAVAVLPPTVPEMLTPVVPPVPEIETPVVAPVAANAVPVAAAWLFTVKVLTAAPAPLELVLLVPAVSVFVVAALIVLPPAEADIRFASAAVPADWITF